jgi:Nucleotide-diphospho-sugar transferase
VPGLNSNVGVVYVAWGDPFVAEAVNSAASVTRSNGIPCVLITDKDLPARNPFSNVVVREFHNSYRDKIKMKDSPFERTIFLDTDTYVLGSLQEVFQLLDRFDVAFQPASGGMHYTLPGIPMEAFPEPSAGIVAWRKNERTDAFFANWESAYISQQEANGPGAWDQRSMRQALWESDVSISTLPGVWQLCSFDVGICLGKVKMVHGRGPDAARAQQKCNEHLNYRVYIPKLGFYSMYKTGPLDYLRLSLAAFFAFMRRGVRTLLHHARIWRLPENKRPM